MNDKFDKLARQESHPDNRVEKLVGGKWGKVQVPLDVKTQLEKQMNHLFNSMWELKMFQQKLANQIVDLSNIIEKIEIAGEQNE